jgi:hypothetical protein
VSTALIAYRLDRDCAGTGRGLLHRTTPALTCRYGRKPQQLQSKLAEAGRNSNTRAPDDDREPIITDAEVKNTENVR